MARDAASVMRLIVVFLAVLAVISLLAFVRGDDGDLGRSPELGTTGAPASGV